MKGPDQYLLCTEVVGEEVSLEQVERMARRYYWAGSLCTGLDVVEVACGTGQGLGYLRSCARSLRAGDISPEMVARALETYRHDDITILRLEAEALPFDDHSLDVVLLFEAVYYLQNPEVFIKECVRILRPGGKVLIATANPDLYDFTASPFSFRYFGAADFAPWFGPLGFEVRLLGDTPLAEVGFRQRLLRPLKGLASRLDLIPSTMKSKRMLKRMFFGAMSRMPERITQATAPWVEPCPIPPDRPDRRHKVLFCEATLRGLG